MVVAVAALADISALNPGLKALAVLFPAVTLFAGAPFAVAVSCGLDLGLEGLGVTGKGLLDRGVPDVQGLVSVLAVNAVAALA